MPFWPVVIATLLGVPALLLFTGMGMIFWAAGLAGGPQESRAQTIVHGWLAIAWLLASVFGAFGLAPAWRAWHGGSEDFAGGARQLTHWLLGTGGAGLMIAGVVRALGRARASGSPMPAWARWPLLALGLAPWAALIAWLVWPLAMWALNGSLDWPDAASGWARTGKVTLVLLAVLLIEDALRERSRR